MNLCLHCNNPRPSVRGRRYCDSCKDKCRICWVRQIKTGQKCLECSNVKNNETTIVTKEVVTVGNSNNFIVSLVKELYGKKHIYHAKGCDRNPVCSCDIHKITSSLLNAIPDLPVVKKEK